MVTIEVLGLFLCATAVLTSPVAEGNNTDGAAPPALEALFGGNRASTTATRSIDEEKIAAVSEANPVQEIISEGGSLHVPPLSTSSTSSVVVAEGVVLTPGNSSPSPDDSHSGSGKSSVKARKGAFREVEIEPRKEVDSEQDSHDYGIVGNTTGKLLNDNLNGSESPVAGLSTASTIASDLSGIKIDVGNRTAPVVILMPGKETANLPKVSSTTTKPPKSRKSKPTKTIGENDEDKPIPASPTKTTLGMPRKIDYIVPVVITVMALPTLGIAAFVLYRRGRDCWDKRHYRRMDFLIDGMYND